MQNLLEKLWNTYQMEHPNEENRERLVLQRKITACQERLFPTMTPEQVELFCECEENMSKCESIAEKEAFVTGVRFAVRFLIEAFEGCRQEIHFR